MKLNSTFLHKNKHKVLFRFILVLLVFLGYALFIVLKYGIANGISISCLTWSFFVLCTPVADAGFLLDFPLRLITKLRMWISEIMVWSIAILLNIYNYFLHPEIYDKTILLSVLKHILDQPFPFWAIIIISCLGTFLSIYFGDELLDVLKHSDRKKHQKHKHKYYLLVFVFMIILIFILYNFLLKKLGIQVL